jgi:two-component system, OmpR family, response regulator
MLGRNESSGELPEQRIHDPRPTRVAEKTAPLLVLHVEDDERVSRVLASYFESRGARVASVANGSEAVPRALRLRPDVILLDVNLPGMDGVAVCRRLRDEIDTPIVIVTAFGEEPDRVVGLEAGADDYVVKPFSVRELFARIEAQARRARGRVTTSARHLVAGPLRIDTLAMFVTMAGRPVVLTTYEFALLRALAERKGRVVTREQAMELVKGTAEESFDRSVDIHVSNLRRKLHEDPRSPRLIKTVRGIGYLLVDPEEE